MTYATDQLKQYLSQVLSESESNHLSSQSRLAALEGRAFALESRVAELEAYITKAKPYIDTFVLIDPEPEQVVVK